MAWTNKNTPAWRKHYLAYLKSYEEHLDFLDTPISQQNNYDFEAEHKLVEKCEAGETLSINDLSPREHE